MMMMMMMKSTKNNYGISVVSKKFYLPQRFCSIETWT